MNISAIKGGVLIALLFTSTITVSAVEISYSADMSAQITLKNFNPAAGDYVSVPCDTLNNWSTTASLLTNSPSNTSIYTGTFNFTNATGTTVNYKFFIGATNGGGGTWEDDGFGPNGARNRQFTVPSASEALPLVHFDNLTNGSSLFSTNPPFHGNVVGVDLSLLDYYKSQGMTYKNNGQPGDVLQMLKAMGVNCVRLRLFTSSAAQAQADPYDYINNLSYTVPLAQQIKSNGLQLLLDFHYSDTWAGPGKQTIPSAWTNLTFTQLVQKVDEYSSNAVATFKAAGATPDYVQVGNEIDGGMLWPYGEVTGSYNTPAQWSQLGQLLDAGIQGIKDGAGTNMPKIIIHISQGGSWGNTQWFFDNLIQQQVPFDIIGESYYPIYNISLASLSNCLTQATKRYNRSVFVAETAFPWNSSPSTNVVGIPCTTNGQVRFVAALAQVVKSVPGKMVPGVFWWGVEYPGNWKWSWFDGNGNVFPVASAFGQMASPVVFGTSLTGTNLTLTWPLSGVGMSLESSDLLQPWTPVTSTVQNSGTIFFTTTPLNANPDCFYRLRSD